MHIPKRLAVLAALGLASTVALAACGDDTGDDTGGATPGFEDCDENPDTCNSGERAEGGSITWVVNAKPDAWNPISPEGGSVYALQMINGVLPFTGQWMPSGEYKFNMDLLSAEPELLSEDPFTYEFYLSEDAVWDDGTPITADDFRVTWMMSTSEDEGHCEGCRSRSPGGADSVENIEGSEDGKTVTITLKPGEATAEWFGDFSAHGIAGGIFPAHIAEENGYDIDDPASLGEYFEYLNTTMPTFSGGPYVLADGDLENQVIKEPNENWYGEVSPTLDTVVLRFLDDEDTWIPALTNGEIHGSSPATFGEDVIRQAQDMPNVLVNIGPGPSWEHIDFNLNNEQLQDLELRRAIFTAVDSDDIASRTYGPMFPDYTLRTNHVFPGASEFHQDHLAGTGFGTGDVEEARSILEAAGYEGFEEGAGPLTLDGEQVGPFRLRSTATSVRTVSMELIQSYLAEIGIEINIEPTDSLGGTLAEADYDIMQFGWSGSPFFVNTPFQQWHSTSGSNFGGYENEQVDTLVEQVLQQSDLAEAARLANEATAIVTNDAYVLPILETPVYIFVTDDYINVRNNSNTSLYGLYEHHEWGLAAQ